MNDFNRPAVVGSQLGAALLLNELEAVQRELRAADDAVDEIAALAKRAMHAGSWPEELSTATAVFHTMAAALSEAIVVTHQVAFEARQIHE